MANDFDFDEYVRARRERLIRRNRKRNNKNTNNTNDANNAGSNQREKTMQDEEQKRLQAIERNLIAEEHVCEKIDNIAVLRYAAARIKEGRVDEAFDIIDKAGIEVHVSRENIDKVKCDVNMTVDDAMHMLFAKQVEKAAYESDNNGDGVVDEKDLPKNTDDLEYVMGNRRRLW